jgi:BlaI family transcriptional regulator, penicillinase repressor
MARPASGRPTDQELEILKVLWQQGPSSVRDVWKAIAQTRDIGYTSVLKIMQIMRDKNLLACDARKRPQVYRPRRSQQATLKQLAGDLLKRAFGGSARSLLLHALGNERASPNELDEIRKLLDELEGKTR